MSAPSRRGRDRALLPGPGAGLGASLGVADPSGVIRWQVVPCFCPGPRVSSYQSARIPWPVRFPWTARPAAGQAHPGSPQGGRHGAPAGDGPSEAFGLLGAETGPLGGTGASGMRGLGKRVGQGAGTISMQKRCSFWKIPWLSPSTSRAATVAGRGCMLPALPGLLRAVAARTWEGGIITALLGLGWGMDPGSKDTLATGQEVPPGMQGHGPDLGSGLEVLEPGSGLCKMWVRIVTTAAGRTWVPLPVRSKAALATISALLLKWTAPGQ